ncbi:MAG TPA: TIGR04282 family arsenosugar biosynthesis glycosyltransferase [Candidatus Deferrimicrobium sp.]|nr:TIGR04282 family arsenosugar biosynthesis glycosyltransferase [Candidatus Deferrimicrobium sp.]
MPIPANALAIMAKAPVAGGVKTRLVPPLTPAQAAEFYRALLLDQFDHLRHYAGAERYVFYAPAEAGNILRELGGDDYGYLAQCDGDLGARMQHIFTELRRLGHRNIILIGSDLPALPWAILDEGFAQLAQAQPQVILGPSRDGGYYLVGLNRPTPEIFQQMTWSHDQVLAETQARLRALAVPFGLLPGLFDFDTVEDLRDWRDAKDMVSSAAMPRTREYLKKLTDSDCLDPAD